MSNQAIQEFLQKHADVLDNEFAELIDRLAKDFREWSGVGRVTELPLDRFSGAYDLQLDRHSITVVLILSTDGEVQKVSGHSSFILFHEKDPVFPGITTEEEIDDLDDRDLCWTPKSVYGIFGEKTRKISVLSTFEELDPDNGNNEVYLSVTVYQ